MLRAKSYNIKPSPIAITVSNRKVNVFTCEINVMHCRGYPEIDVRMRLSESTEPMYEPFGGKVRRRADCQNPGGLTLHKTFCPDSNPIQCVADHCKIFATSLGNHKSLALAVEKFDAEGNLQRLDLMAHGSLCDIQFLSRTCKALAARRSLEGLERIQRWQTAKHCSSFMRKTKPR